MCDCYCEDCDHRKISFSFHVYGRHGAHFQVQDTTQINFHFHLSSTLLFNVEKLRFIFVIAPCNIIVINHEQCSHQSLD